MDTRQLLDSLTAHLSLYHRRSPALRNPNPNPRKAILRWFSDLPLHQRRSALTIVDRAFVRVLLQMQARARARGHGSFLLLPDIPSSDPSVPALCFRKSTGLLERSGVSDAPERSILGGLLLFRSREGMKGEDCALDSVIVTEGLVGDVDRFVEVMDGVSDGGFLRGEVDGLGSAWCELEWLKDKGYYSVGSFVANRLEVALRMSWLNSKGGKKQKGAKLKDKDNGSAVAANVFWRKKGCLDWFLGLDPGIRKKIVMTFLRKGAKSLAKEILNSYGPYGSAKDEMCNLKDVLAPHRSCSGNRSYQRQHQLHCDLEFSVSLATESSTTRGSLFHSCLVELLVLQQITSMLVAYDNNEIGAECLIFSTLDSVQTVFDLILVRFRGFLTVVARDSIEHELVATVNTSHPITRKTKEKLAVDVRCKNKCRNPKRANSNLKPSKVDLSLKESCVHLRSGSEKGKHTVEVVGEIKLTNSSSMKDTPGSNKHSSTINMGHRVLDNHQSSVSRKKSKRRGATCKSIIKEVAKAEKPTMLVADSASLLSVENEGSELNLENTSMLNVLSNDNRIQDNLQLQSSTVELQDKSLTRSGRETSNANIVDVLPYSMCGSYACHMDHKKSGQFENENPGNDVEIPSSGPTWSNISFCNSVNSDAATSNLKESLEDLNSIVQKVELISCADKASPSSIKELGSDNLRSGDDPSTQPISTDNLCNEAVDGSRFSSDYCICSSQSPTIPIGGKSYEWPNLNSVHFSHFNSGHLPAATDRYHLDVTYNWPNNFHQSYYSGRHQIRTSCIDHGGGQMVPSVTPPASIDWPPMVRSSTLGHSGAFSYDFVYNTRLQSSLCTGISDLGIQFRGTSGDNEWKYSGDGAGLHDYKKTFDFVEDTESNWLSEEEYDMHTTNARDYNKFFGGGIMYWNPSDPVGTSFSRAPSHSSEESSWAWYESDLSRAIDDMIDVPGFPSSYTANGLASPTSGTFCSPFDGIGPGSQSHSHGYVISTTEVNKKALDSQCPVAEVVEEKVPGSKNTSSGNIEGAKIDSLPYPILRPIVIPSSSRKSSRSEFRYSQDHVSPCPPSRRDAPRIKRPPSPVVLCVPRAPRVPPPSPVGESRKHRGFPVVRSGSSSPRNWGTRNCHQGESKSEGTQYCMDGPEVVWASWGSKGISNNSAMQSIPGSLLQDRLIAISQLARDQDHPDVAFPLQPPETVNCPSRKLSFSVMHSFLQEEINSFCKQVANENQLKKPYINWSVKRVAKSLQVLWPRSRTSIFGSNATGLALPTSDVDLVVCLPPVRNLEPIKEAGILEGRNGIKETCLQHAARYLANQEWVKNDSLKTIENTTIPLIMLVAEVPLDIIASNGTHSGTKNLEVMPASMGESGKDSLCGSSILENVSVSSCSSSSCTAVARAISVDISFKSPSHTGLQTTALVRELTEQFPAAVPLALVLKQFLADRSLDRAYSGGLSSYCLVLLITRFLQHEHHIGRPLNQNLGSLLMDFLYFFGNVFDPRQMRVSIQGSGLYMNRERGHSIDPIHIDDPLCPTNNVGRNCFRIHQCIKAFADAYSVLESELSLFSADFDPCAQASIKLLPKIIPSTGLHGQGSLEIKNKD